MTKLIQLLGFLPPLESRLQNGITFWNAVGIISPLFYTWDNARQGGGLTCHHAARGGAGLDIVLGGFDLCR